MKYLTFAALLASYILLTAPIVYFAYRFGKRRTKKIQKLVEEILNKVDVQVKNQIISNHPRNIYKQVKRVEEISGRGSDIEFKEFYRDAQTASMIIRINIIAGAIVIGWELYRRW